MSKCGPFLQGMFRALQISVNKVGTHTSDRLSNGPGGPGAPGGPRTVSPSTPRSPFMTPKKCFVKNENVSERVAAHVSFHLVHSHNENMNHSL